MIIRSSHWLFAVRVFLLFFCTIASFAENQHAPSDTNLVIESRSVVFNSPQTDPYDRTNHYGFNHAASIIRLPDGRLLCAWFSGPFEASVHQVILAAYSEDQGRTWQKAFVLQDEPHMSDFDPAFIVDGNRVWFFYVYGRWNRYPSRRSHDKETAYVGKESYHLYARYSDDNGATWSRERMIHRTAGSRSNGIKLASGELLLPVHDFIDLNKSGVIRSLDKGDTWQLVNKVINKEGVAEPTIAQLNNGNILMALRTGDDHLWTCVSKDRGENWDDYKMHDMLATRSSHNLFQISNGQIALTHNACKAGLLRSPLTMRLTKDGLNWSKPIILAESLTPEQDNDYWSCQVCYPSVCELEDKTLVVVYANINIGNMSQYGEIHCVRIKAE